MNAEASSKVRFLRSLAAIVALTAAFSACRKSEPAPQPDAATPSTTETTPTPESPAPTPRAAASTSAAAAPSSPANPPPKEIWKEFSGEKAMEEVAKQVNIGPRPSGSAEDEKARELIVESLQAHGWEATRQEFTDSTPRGPVKFVNIIGRFPGIAGHPTAASTQQAIVCSHYDTKRFSTIRFVGASDGASSTGALLELARVLALDPAMATKIELVFFDGEEAVESFTDTDGLWGSRYYASSLRADGRAHQFKFAILWDMIGDRDLTVTLPPNSPPDLAKGLFSAAETLGTRQNFGYFGHDILDDHVPISKTGIPSIDVIDFDYLYWHTADDTLDKISGESLQKVAAATIYLLRQRL